MMMMTRGIRQAVGDDKSGYRLAWQIVVDSLKLTSANPTFLEGRDAILRALDDLRAGQQITDGNHRVARSALWAAFAHFGMGANAFSMLGSTGPPLTTASPRACNTNNVGGHLFP